MKDCLFKVFALIFCIGSVIWCTGCEIEESQTPQLTNQEGIIGGTPTNYQDWKGVIAVRGGGYFGGLCSGTLIHPKVVLTAGHCVKLGGSTDFTKNPAGLTIMNGARAFLGRQIAQATKVLAHPTWSGELEVNSGDLALILLNKEITNLPTYPLRDFPMPEEGSAGKLVGYGANSGNGMGSGTHRQGDTTLLRVLSDLIETGVSANTCSGDSGGPLFTEQDGEWHLTGVTSFGNAQACYRDHGSYSVNLLAYCDWLNKSMIELVGEDLGLAKCSVCSAKAAATWGQPCGEGYLPCPEDTKCRAPEEYSDGNVGFCAPSCCSLMEADSQYCTDVSDGYENCAVMSEKGDRYCAISCEDTSECPEGTTCKNKPFKSEKICIATEEGPGGPDATTDVDIDDDFDPNPDSDPNSDTDSSADSGIDPVDDADANDPDKNDPESCGCRAIGANMSGSLLFLLLQSLF